MLIFCKNELRFMPLTTFQMKLTLLLMRIFLFGNGCWVYDDKPRSLVIWKIVKEPTVYFIFFQFKSPPPPSPTTTTIGLAGPFLIFKTAFFS